MNLLFDLDGTLIDSSQGIQNAFNYAYEEVYKKKSPYAIKEFVGPPIRDILMNMTGEQNEERIADFVRSFQMSYDAKECTCCSLYDGMTDVLSFLKEEKLKVYISTNKRRAPTEIIIKHLKIEEYFDGIYCIDSIQPSYSSKDIMVAYILKTEGITHDNTILIGDTIHDKVAAEKNGIGFIFAAYGFGNLYDAKHSIQRPLDIIDFLNFKKDEQKPSF